MQGVVRNALWKLPSVVCNSLCVGISFSFPQSKKIQTKRAINAVHINPFLTESKGWANRNFRVPYNASRRALLFTTG